MDKKIEIKRGDGAMVDLLNQEMKELQDEQKDIEEMIGIIQNAVGERAKYWAKLIAVNLRKNNYRKIPENAVVLKKEEYEKVKHVLKYEPEEAIIRLEDLAKNERLYSPHMFCSLGGCSGVRKGCNRTCKESWIVIERKETAEKFKVLLKGTVPQGLLDEICKEFKEGE